LVAGMIRGENTKEKQGDQEEMIIGCSHGSCLICKTRRKMVMKMSLKNTLHIYMLVDSCQLIVTGISTLPKLKVNR
jgi:hypothetical protein